MNIKMIIFDQDGTLYPSNHDLFRYTRKKTKKWLSKKLNISSEEIDKIYKTLSTEYPNPYFGFMSLGCSIDEYMSEVFDKIEPSEFLTFNPTLYEYFEKSKEKKSLVTLASPKYTNKLQEVLKLKKFYDEILYVKDFETYNKKQCYKKVADDFNLKFSEICVIGDSLENDIKPAKELGCKTVWISHNSEIVNIEDFILMERRGRREDA